MYWLILVGPLGHDPTEGGPLGGGGEMAVRIKVEDNHACYMTSMIIMTPSSS